MLHPAADEPKARARRWSSPAMAVAGAALFVALGGSAIAAGGLTHARDLATGAVTSAKIRNGTIQLRDISAVTLAALQGPQGETGSTGAAGGAGTTGSPGTNGINGTSGPNGNNGHDGSNGLTGPQGADGTNGTNGTNGTDGTITPLFATDATATLASATPPTTVVALTVPAGNYVIMAKTQLTHSGAGDSIDCTLKDGTTVLDHVAMKTMPALAALPVSMQAVRTTVGSSTLSIECDVMTADGSATWSSLIALPTA